MKIHSMLAALTLAVFVMVPSTSHAQISLTFDYTYDTSGWFSDPTFGAIRTSTLEKAASEISMRLADTLTDIAPSGANTWTLRFTDPSTGLTDDTSEVDRTISSNTLVLFAGARDLGGSTLGKAGPGGFSAGGTLTWIETVRARGEPGANFESESLRTDFAPWGGSIAFDTDSTWHYDWMTSPGGGKNDFYSVALHELGHVLGVGTAPSWDNLINGSDEFTGSASMLDYGSPVPVEADGGHWLDDLDPVTENNQSIESTLPGTATLQEVAMDPSITVGTRKLFTDLDYAGLDDLGWEVTPVPEPEEIAFLVAVGLLGFAVYRRKRTPVSATTS